MFDANRLAIMDTIGNKKLIIPFFQRNYVWKEELWEKYWDSMEKSSNAEANSGCFLGSIILKQKYTSSGEREGNVRSVIDGQQRLITTFLFFKAVCTVYGEEAQEKFYISNFYKTYAKGEREILLDTCDDDKEAFDEIIESTRDTKFNKKTEKSKVYECYKYFCDRSEKETAMDLDNCIEKSYFVVIDLDNEDDAQQIFNTINDIGEPLTTAQLLKNHLFQGQEQKDEHDFYWKETFEGEKRDFWDFKLTAGRERRTNIDVFLQAFFNLYNDESAKGRYEKLNDLYARYKNFLKGINRKQFLENLRDYGNIYRTHINPNCVIQQRDNKSTAMDRINLIIFSLNTTTIIPYVLFVLKNIEDKKEQEKMLSLVESYVMRRFVCNWTTKNYNNIFSTLKDKANNYTSLKDWMQLHVNTNEETNEFPSDKHVISSFQNARIKNKNARVILYFIEMHLHEKENKNQNDKDVLIKKNYPLRAIKDYSIEHIMPVQWDKNWKDLPDGFEIWQRNEKIKTLGNLILLTMPLNAELSNSGWNIKKKKLELHSGGVKTFSIREKWSEIEIEERTEFLIEKSIEIWTNPS